VEQAPYPSAWLASQHQKTGVTSKINGSGPVVTIGGSPKWKFWPGWPVGSHDNLSQRDLMAHEDWIDCYFLEVDKQIVWRVDDYDWDGMTSTRFVLKSVLPPETRTTVEDLKLLRDPAFRRLNEMEVIAWVARTSKP
jgi:hypothetical protein